MSALKSSVLLIDHPHPESVQFGSDFAQSFEDASARLKDTSYAVVAVPLKPNSRHKVQDFLENLNELNKEALCVLLYNDFDFLDIRQYLQSGNVHRVVKDYSSLNFEKSVQESLEYHDLKHQNLQLLNLVQEQNNRLRKLTLDLEERVSLRQKSLRQSQKRLQETNRRVIALHNTLLAIHRAKSIPEMESQINEALSEALNLSWTKITFSQAQEEAIKRLESGKLSLLKVQLFNKSESIGSIFFSRQSNKPFLKDETNFLQQVAEGVSLAIGRTTKLQQSETLKQQWETTFDAISSPVCLVTEDNVIARSNKAFQTQFPDGPPDNIQKLGVEESGIENYRLVHTSPEGNQQVFKVQKQALPFEISSQKLHIKIYTDQSEQLQLEQQVLESAKMAELGTIGSSIAHELNNPLGGMLNFIQLIKMGLSGQESYFEDIKEMEDGAVKCKEIIQNLLGFTRRADLNELKENDVREIVEQALKITEIQTRAIGIKTKTVQPDEPVLLKVQFNLLSQVVRNILQNAQEAIVAQKKNTQEYEGFIHVMISEDKDSILITIVDNGIAFNPEDIKHYFDPLFTTKSGNHTGIGLTIAAQIISGLKGSIEVIDKTEEKGFGIKIPKNQSENSDTNS